MATGNNGEKKMKTLYIINMTERERIGLRIREIMNDKNISTYKLAELTGIKQQNISRILLGKYSTGIDILSKIGDALNYRLDFVVK